LSDAATENYMLLRIMQHQNLAAIFQTHFL
jgi:hypothetical protein